METQRVRSRIDIIDVAEEIQHDTEHRMIRYQSQGAHVITDISTKKPSLLLLELHLVHLRKRSRPCFTRFPALPTLVKVLAEQGRRAGFVGWKRDFDIVGIE